MPWDGTTLWSAEIGEDGGLAQVRQVAGGERESIVQPEWSPDGQLYFVSDRSGWWNIYRASDDGADACLPDVCRICRAGLVVRQPLVWFPRSRNASSPASARTAAGSSRASTSPPVSSAGSICPTARSAASRSTAAARCCAPARPTGRRRSCELDPASGVASELCTRGRRCRSMPPVSRSPEPIAFASGGAARACLLLSADQSGVQGTGGRAAAADRQEPRRPDRQRPRASCASPTQFWTSRGFALCDVNYGGSTGYGRAYRERLNGRWGEVDVEDCLNAARFLVADGRADENRLAITGGSAGGYTTLCALTFHDLFRAGASHYGISDLEALAKDTHKFESRYLDRLVGPYPEAAALYRARSPIHHVDRLSCPCIFFQGLEDAVVPPDQAELMVEALRSKGLPVAYLAFAGEQHGFRRAETIQTVLRAELTFYGRIFGFAPGRPAAGPRDREPLA